jgi:hypothetical protein
MPSFFDPLWVVTSYYNPAGYRRRLQNFHAFRRKINAPLMVVELAKPGRHQLSRDDADFVLSLTGEDRIWQKERLLNIGAAELPPHVRYVAWVDCDIIFSDENWAGAAASQLDANGGGLLQLFDTAVHLPADADLSSLSAQTCGDYTPLSSGISIAKGVRDATFETNEVKLSTARAMPDTPSYNLALDGYNVYGMAWAALRSALEPCGQYDRNIIGGGDAVHVYAALDKLDDFWAIRAYSPMQRKDAEAWALKAHAAGLFSYIDAAPQTIYHMWHGDLPNRNYRGRYEILARLGYDPDKDLELAANGTWRWTDPDGDLAREVGAYFFSRREDGGE